MKKYLLSLAAGLLLIGLAIGTGYPNDVSYTYDQLNRLVAIEYLDGTRIEYTYDDLGNRITQNVFISSNPVANFSLSLTTGPAPLTVTFTDQSAGTITSRSWSFGDGGGSTSQNPVYTYNNAGTYTVLLTVSNGVSSSAQSKTITVNPAIPVANFIASPTSGTVPLAVSFTDSSTGDITGWSWTFGDGGTSTLQNPSHTYSNPGTYTVTLIAIGPGGNSNPQTTSIAVIPPPPVANFSASPTSGAVPLAVQFTDASTGSVTSWSWSFGDGGTSTIQDPGHTYTNPGTYTATLIAGGPGGNSNPQTTSITVVSPPPVANFSATPTSGTAPLSVQFTDASTGPVTNWSWVFGDGGTSTSQDPIYTYSTPGTYTVSLTATGPGGANTNTETNYITVNSPGIDQYTKLMLHFNGPNGSRTFTDSELTPKTVTGQGDAQISTAYSEFGGASLKLDGSSGSYLLVPASPDWNFSGDFTIDFWWYHTGGTYNAIISEGTGSSGTDSLLIGDWNGVVYVWMSSKGTSWDIANEVKIGTPSATGFDHYALVRAGGTYYTFQNGVQTNSFGNQLTPYYKSPVGLNIGGPWSGSYYAKGYLDELRVSNGVARWTTNFTPPSAQYTVGSTPPTAGFSADWTSGPAPLLVQCADTSTGSVTGWSWNFGDGSTSTAQYPSHVYSNPGIYTVSLTATGPGGSNTNTETNYVTVSAASNGIDQYTKLMLHFDGPNGSMTFTDSELTPKTVTGYGDAQISTAYSEFGGASLKLDGSSGSYLLVPASPDW
ncbi:MAG: PKD domain-containing protein, partial [Syntrophobacteraceae bacterium]